MHAYNRLFKPRKLFLGKVTSLSLLAHFCLRLEKICENYKISFAIFFVFFKKVFDLANLTMTV